MQNHLSKGGKVNVRMHTHTDRHSNLKISVYKCTKSLEGDAKNSDVGYFGQENEVTGSWVGGIFSLCECMTY